MNYLLLNTDIQNFIASNLNNNISELILKGSPFPDISIKDIVEQIESKRKAKDKLPTWFQNPNIYYPNKLNIEQTSSEVTAKYKSELIQGNSMMDLTGGFGVDCFYFSKSFKHVIHCEINPELSNMVASNWNALNISNIKSIQANGLEYLDATNDTFDWIYLDPSRRHETKGKVFFLKDCEPNVPENLNKLFKKSSKILIKTSPLLDLHAGLKELNHVKKIHVVAVKNEVKELLWMLEKDFSDNIAVETVNKDNEKAENFSFLLDDESNQDATFSPPETYLYEPNAAILKSGGFKSVSTLLHLNKLHQHSHLYTSKNIIDFPGRIFEIKNVIPYNKKELKKAGIKKANITVRNFPESVQHIRQKHKITDGGNLYLFFTTNNLDEKIIIICNKIKF